MLQYQVISSFIIEHYLPLIGVIYFGDNSIARHMLLSKFNYQVIGYRFHIFMHSCCFSLFDDGYVTVTMIWCFYRKYAFVTDVTKSQSYTPCIFFHEQKAATVGGFSPRSPHGQDIEKIQIVKACAQCRLATTFPHDAIEGIKLCEVLSFDNDYFIDIFILYVSLRITIIYIFNSMSRHLLHTATISCRFITY